MQRIVYNAVTESPIGRIGIQCQDDFLLHIDLQVKQACKPADNALANLVITQLRGYFDGTLGEFSIPLLLQGTAFQQRVWHQLQAIPRGQTSSYGQVAEQLNSGARAVGNACRANKIPIIIPCHRITAKSGVGGFAGARSGPDLDIKKHLLHHERTAVTCG